MEVNEDAYTLCAFGQWKHQVGKEKRIEGGKEICETEEESKKKRMLHRSKYRAVVLTEILVCAPMTRLSYRCGKVLCCNVNF